MKSTFILKKLPLVILISGLVLTVSFAQNNSAKIKSQLDTLPKKEKKIRDFDEALSELDKGEVELSKAFKEIDGEKLEREIRESLKGMDVDLAKMKVELAKTMKEIDMQKMTIEMQKAFKEIDAEKLKRDVDASVASIDVEKMKAELEKVKDIDLAKMRQELENIRPEMEKSMQAAKKDIEQARQEISLYKSLVNALDQDGLLDKNKNYKIEYENKELVVNGKKVPADAVKKYSEYLTGKDNFTIQKEDDDFDIHHK